MPESQTYTPIKDQSSQRLHLFPQDRIPAVATVAAMVGGAQGFFSGIKISSLRYLTENAHRLPHNVGGWYFYHKKKNYIMLLAGFRQAAALAVKYSAGVSVFLAAEAAIDYSRESIDFLNTTVVGTVASYAFGSAKHMTSVQKRNFVKKGAMLALLYGVAQDAMIYSRGGNLWYTKYAGIEQKAFQH